MKIIATAVFTSIVFISGAMAEVKIGGSNNQKVTVQNGAIANMAIGPVATAKQNIASNKGNVKIGGSNNQEVTVKNGAIANMAIGPGAKSEQNVASNDGK